MSIIKYLTPAFSALLLVSVPAKAAVVDFQFVGTVTYSQGLASVGSQIVGTFSYDTNAAPNYVIGDANGWMTNYSIYAPYALQASFSSHTVASATAGHYSVGISDNIPQDLVNISSGAGFKLDDTIISNSSSSFGFQLASKVANSGALSGFSLPTSYDVAAFDADPGLNYGWINSSGEQDGRLLKFSVQSVTAVPLPSGFTLMMSGLAMVGGLCTRRSLRT